MKKVTLLILCAMALLPFISKDAMAHGTNHPVKEWTFWPDYTLPGTAHNYPGDRPEHPENPVYFLKQVPEAFSLMGQAPTEHYWELLKAADIPEGPFSVEMWVLVHVNQPVGLSVNQVSGKEIDWSLGFYDRSLYLTAEAAGAASDGIFHTFPREEKGYFSHKGYKEKWHHIVASFDGELLTLYYNGEVIGTKTAPSLKSQSFDSRLEVTAYMENEEYMQTGNSLHTLAVYDYALNAHQIGDIMHRRQALVEQGRLFEDIFHFTAGPYLNAVDAESVKLMFETDRPSTAVVQWGETATFGNQFEFSSKSRVHKTALTGLKPNYPYFYEVTVKDENGTEMKSGRLTFRTAPQAGEPITFAVVGDTEARAHVNDIIMKRVWAERPHFVVLVGDLTDGGTANHRWQWTHEYFLGINQLGSRVPFLPAPGNGEDDLVWYNHYHNLPAGDRSYYSHRVGDIEFFMLDSNMGHHNAHRPGFREKQRTWLRDALKKSTAKWKVAAHHHPTYSSDENDYGDTYREQSRSGDSAVKEDFLDLYEEYGVDAVFFGHLHSYERTWPVLKEKVDKSGVVYVQTGGGGGNHERAGPTRNWFTNQLYSGYHYTLVKQYGDTMTITVRDSEGRLRDQFEIKK